MTPSTPAVTTAAAASPSQVPAPNPSSATPLNPRKGRRGIGNGRLSPGNALGTGGQGTVSAVSGRPDLVLKTFARPIAGGVREFQQLIDRGERVQRVLAASKVDLCWPEEVHGSATDLEGYVMPRLQTSNYFPVATKGGIKQIERTLDWAIWTSNAFQVPFKVTDADRLEIVRCVARWLSAMHDTDVAYGDVSFKNLCFSLDPEVRVAVFDFDSARVLGSRSFTAQETAHSPDWHDPYASSGFAATLDTDRYKFALLAFRLLVSRQLGGDLDPANVPVAVSGLSAAQTHRLRTLWSRAAGASGSRPSMREWLDALAA
ncbi:hypothetical protein [Nocardioides sediminis]|uniref:hypothetical protein n=1 Tax=Nocardioides sediminis TaxID=433648 RepID=UPI00131F1867|nr:hypothetical protein [Nocardioides sediminis]